MKFMVRRVLWKVTEWKDDCIYRTESLGLVWIPHEEDSPEKAKELGGDFFGSLSTEQMNKLPLSEQMRMG